MPNKYYSVENDQFVGTQKKTKGVMAESFSR